MSYPNQIENLAAAVQAELQGSITQLRQQKAPTLQSFKSGTGARGKAGRLAGLEIPYFKNVPHGSVALDVLSGTTSFGDNIAATTDKMYVGLTQTGVTVEWEHFHQHDPANPLTKEQLRDMTLAGYYQEHNWYAWGVGDGALAVVASGGGGGSGTITLANDNTARGRSKGSLRLAVSPGTTAGKRVLYESWTKSTDTKTATFYITSKASSTTAVIVVTDGGTVVAGDIIVKAGTYKKVPYGLGYHISESGRQYQGASTSTDTFLNSRRVDGGGSVIDPSTLDAAKGAMEVRANDEHARDKRICHLSHGNYRQLAAYGYSLRQYNAEKGQADTTYGMIRGYQDEDTIFVQDSDGEDAYIYFRDRKSYFHYRQQDMMKISKGDGTQWIGTNEKGSTEFFDDYGESYNLAWDGRGDDGKGGASSANSSVVIDNLAIPSINQMAENISLV